MMRQPGGLGPRLLVNVGGRLLLTVVLLRLWPPGEVFARVPEFEMHACADRAQRIVVGKLDENGRLTIDAVIKGAADRHPISVRLGADIYEPLRRAMNLEQGAPIHVVAFFAKENSTLYDAAGVVGLAGEAVYTRQRVRTHSDPQYARHPTHTAKSFLAATQAAVRIAGERRALIALPRSPERARKLVAFLAEHGRSFRAEGPPARGQRSTYHVFEIAHAVSPMNAEEERVILAALETSKSSYQRVLILDLASATRFSGRAFETIARLIDRKRPRAVRHSAIWALAKTDGYRAAAHFAPRLSLEDPELGTLLAALSSGRPQDRPLNAKALDGLLRLAQSLRKHHREKGRDVLRTKSGTTLHLMQLYAHPRLAPILLEWATANDHASSEEAAFTLRVLTGLQFGRLQKDAWGAWWRKAKPILAKPYLLSTQEGRKAWCDAYSRADPATQKVLVRSWFFEKPIDEKALIELSTGRDARRAAAAKAALSKLWQRRRLSAASRKTIVVLFLNPKLVEVPSNIKGRHELQVITERDFPFPNESWVEPRCGWTVGHNVIPPGDNWSTLNLYSGHPVLLGSFGGGAKGGTMATCDLEIREVGGSKGGKVQWIHLWTLGPIRLRDPQ